MNSKNKVAFLEHENTLELPSTFRLSEGCVNFEVMGDLALIVDSYGPLHGFNLSSGREEVFFPFKYRQVRAMANDGTNLFFCLDGDFELKGTDVLLAKILKPFTSKTDEGKEYMDGFCDFVGKPIQDIEPYFGIRAKESGITKRVVSCNIGDLPRPVLVFAPEEYTNQNPRFLINNDMDSLLFLKSGNGYVGIGYNYHFGEGGCETHCVIKSDGTAISNGSLENCLSTNPFIEIDYSSGKRDFYATLHINKNEEDEEANEDGKAIPIVFAGGRPVHRDRTIAEMQRIGDKVHVLYKPEITKFGVPDWIYRITAPSILDTYKVSLKELI